MKKRFLRYIPLMLGLAITFTACEKDDDDDNDNPFTTKDKNPKVEYTIGVNGVNQEYNEESYLVKQGDTVTFYLKAEQATDGGKLDKIELTFPAQASLNLKSDNENYILVTGIPMEIVNKDNSKLIVEGNLTTANLTTTTYALKITDKNANSTIIKFDLEVTEFGSGGTPFTSTKTGEIWHILGLKVGSWSLTADASVSSANAANDADISNVDDANTGFTGSFKVGDNRSNTDFVKAGASFDYASATHETAEAAYNAGTAITEVTSAPSNGDVYIFNLNGNFSVVKITNIDPNADCGANCNNKGKMEFEYKK